MVVCVFGPWAVNPAFIATVDTLHGVGSQYLECLDICMEYLDFLLILHYIWLSSKRIFNRCWAAYLIGFFYVVKLRELQLVSQVVLKIKTKSYYALSISIMGLWWVMHSWQKRKCLCHKLFRELEVDHWEKNLINKNWLEKCLWA